MSNNLSHVRELIRVCKETQNPYLDIGDCGITDLNDFPELFECIHLETLILSSIWADLETMKQDASSNRFGKNHIYRIPQEISNLKYLKKLIVSSQRSDWTRQNFKAIAKLDRLEFLDISYSNIYDIDFLSNLVELKYLNCTNTELRDISSLSRLFKLECLLLGMSYIKDLSDLSKLTELKMLYVSSGLISDVSYLHTLNKLEVLNLGGNKIYDISFLSNLTKLKTLYLVSNKITEIPQSIFLLNMEISLERHGPGLNLYDNPIVSPPMEILTQGRRSVLNWFEAKKKKLKEIKVILIGEPKAGKTSLLRVLKGENFIEGEEQTDGINIEHIFFGTCKAFEKQKSLHSLTGHFWDFGGQEIMNATHQFFLTNRSVYVVVLDARVDVNVTSQIRHWVKRIRVTGGNSPIIIVANQSDINMSFGFTNERELQEEFPQIKYFIKTSCKTQENIDLVKTRLEELIPKAELFSTEIDERWISIMKKLVHETTSKPFLDETRFIEICDNYELYEKNERKDAINFFNDLGLVLHFEDLKLAEYFVLDPYWITYGVYQILTSSYAGDMKGIVEMDKLEFIINEEKDKKEAYKPVNYKKIKYTNNQRHFLVDILNQFKLSFYLPDRSYFIIPDLLDTNEPNEVTEPIRKASDSIRFMFEYDYLPKSTMPYIMVETHQILKNIWRTGCVLLNNGCKALISNYQNRILITVTGEYKKKREFMAVIRYLIDTINEKINNKPKMLIPLPDIDAYVDYEELLEREKDGEKHFTLYKPVKKKYEISMLLEGILTHEEMKETNLNSIVFSPIIKIENILTNSSVVNFKADLRSNQDFNTLKQLVEDLKQVDIENKQWQENLIAVLSEISALENAQTKEEQKKKWIDVKKVWETMKVFKDIKALSDTIPWLNDKFHAVPGLLDKVGEIISQ